MKQIYHWFLPDHFPYFISKFFVAGIIFSILTTALVQDFTTISCGTSRSQRFGTNEVDGEVVSGEVYMFGGFDANKRAKYASPIPAFAYDAVLNTWSPIADLPQTATHSGFGGISSEGLTTDAILTASQARSTILTSPENTFYLASASKKLDAYPNPLHNAFSIRLPSYLKGDFGFKVADGAGRIYSVGKIKTEEEGSSIKFDISKLSLPPGNLCFGSKFRNRI